MMARLRSWIRRLDAFWIGWIKMDYAAKQSSQWLAITAKDWVNTANLPMDTSFTIMRFTFLLFFQHQCNPRMESKLRRRLERSMYIQLCWMHRIFIFQKKSRELRCGI